KVARYFHRQAGQKFVGGFQLLVHAADGGGLAALHADERYARRGHEDKIGEQIFEGKYIARDRLRDGDFLDGADIADLPVALGTVRVGIVAAHAGLAHDDRNDEAYLVGRHRGGDMRQLLVRVFAQHLERVLLEIVEVVRCAALKRVIRHEAIADILLLFADDVSKLERKRRRNRNGAGN